jgi:two-component system, sensor histidine kinase
MHDSWNVSSETDGSCKSTQSPSRKRSKDQQQGLCESCTRKETFLAVVAHEMRNMLAPIVMALDGYSQSAIDDRDPELLKIATERSRQLSRLIDDLLDAYRLASDKVQLNREKIDLRDIAKRTIQAISPVVDGRRQDLLVTLCDSPLPVYADPLRLEQVFMNLLDNATKNTPQRGCIWVRLYWENNSSVFEVRDSGCGIKFEFIPHLFDFFSRDGDLLAHGSGGLGIGLAVAKSFVELHGGTIEVQSDGPDCGADFKVTLPCPR